MTTDGMEAYARYKRIKKYKDMTLDASLVLLAALLWAVFFAGVGFLLSWWW